MDEPRDPLPLLEGCRWSHQLSKALICCAPAGFKMAGRSISGLRVLECTPLSVHLGQTQEASQASKVRSCPYPQDDQYLSFCTMSVVFRSLGKSSVSPAIQEKFSTVSTTPGRLKRKPIAVLSELTWPTVRLPRRRPSAMRKEKTLCASIGFLLLDGCRCSAHCWSCSLLRAVQPSRPSHLLQRLVQPRGQGAHLPQVHRKFGVLRRPSRRPATSHHSRGASPSRAVVQGGPRIST